MDKTTICLICGGRSTEHQISLLSANSVLKAISRELHNVLTVGIRLDGQWLYYPDSIRMLSEGTFNISEKRSLSSEIPQNPP